MLYNENPARAEPRFLHSVSRYWGGGREWFGGDYYQCPYCLLFYPQQGVHIDHKTPWADIWNDPSWGSTYTERSNQLKNLHLVCSSCNLSKSKNESWQYDGTYRGGLSNGEFEEMMARNGVYDPLW